MIRSQQAVPGAPAAQDSFDSFDALMEITSRPGVVFVEGRGSWLRDQDGKELPIRRNHSLKVFARQPDGRWLIVSDMYMDAHDEATYVSSTNQRPSS